MERRGAVGRHGLVRDLRHCGAGCGRAGNREGKAAVTGDRRQHAPARTSLSPLCLPALPHLLRTARHLRAGAVYPDPATMGLWLGMVVSGLAAHIENPFATSTTASAPD